MARKKILVAGASGLVGYAAVRHFAQRPDPMAFVGESFEFADSIFATGADRPLPPIIVSTIKARQAGFHDCMDTEDMFRKWFKHFQEKRLLAPR